MRSHNRATYALLAVDRRIAGGSASGPSTLNEDQIAERGARLARRDDREYREYLREEQRRQPGCPAREVVLDQRGRATREGKTHRACLPCAWLAADPSWRRRCRTPPVRPADRRRPKRSIPQSPPRPRERPRIASHRVHGT